MIPSFAARIHVPFTRDCLIRSGPLYTVRSLVPGAGGCRETIVWERTKCDPVLRHCYANPFIEKALREALYELEAEGCVVRTESRCDSNDDQRLLCWRLRQPVDCACERFAGHEIASRAPLIS